MESKPAPTAYRPRRRISSRRILLALVLVALLLRLPGLDWGLPYVYHPDEPTHVNIVLDILKTGDLNPHWFKYPSFRIYASLPVAVIYFLLGVARGQFNSIQELNAATMLTCGSGTTKIPGLYAGLRLLMTAFGVLGVGFLYWWGERHWDRRVGFLAALILALSPLHVLVGHWYRPDTVLTLFSGAAVLASALLLRHDDARYYVLCGACAGLAASVKYNAAALQFFPIILAHLLARRDILDWRLWITPLVAGGVFLLITPYALLDLPGFLDGFAFEINHYYVRGHAGSDAAGFGANLLWYLGKLLHYDGPVFLLALTSPFLVDRHRRRETWLLLSWPLMVLALNASAQARTVLALVPATLILCILAAMALDRLLLAIALRWGRFRGRSVLFGVLIALVVLLPAVRLLGVDAAFVQPDARTLAQHWLEQHIPSSSRIMMEAYGPVLEWEGASYSFLLTGHSPEWYQIAGFDYLVASHYWTFFVSPERYGAQIADYERLFEFPQVAAIRGPLQYLYDPMREIRILRVPPAERYELLTSDGDAPWFQEGFHDLEWHEGQPFRWTGGRAVARVPLESGATYRIRLRGNDGRPEDAGQARSVLYADDRLIGEHYWSRTTETWEVDLQVPPGVADKQAVDLRLETDTWKPSAWGGQDGRELGIRLESIAISALRGR